MSYPMKSNVLSINHESKPLKIYFDNIQQLPNPYKFLLKLLFPIDAAIFYVHFNLLFKLMVKIDVIPMQRYSRDLRIIFFFISDHKIIKILCAGS